MSARLPLWDAFIYPLGGFATLEITDTATPAAPDWDTLTIPEPMTCDELGKWVARQLFENYGLADTAGGIYRTGANAGKWYIDATGAYGIRVSQALADHLGLASLSYTATSVPIVSDGTPLGYATPFGIGVSAPEPLEWTELREYRHGRAVAYHANRGSKIETTVFIEASEADALLAGPLFQRGVARVMEDAVVAASQLPATVSNPRGYRDVAPYNVLSVDYRGVDDGHCEIVTECSLLPVSEYAETHYLQFDGVSDSGAAMGVMSAGGHALVIKVYGWISGAGSWQRYATTGAGGNLALTIQRNAANVKVVNGGYNTADALAWFFYMNPDLTGGVTGVTGCYGVSGSTFSSVAADGALEQTKTGVTAFSPKVATDLFIARHPTPDANMGNLAMLGAVVLNRLPTEAEIIAWSVAGVDPRTIWDADTEMICAYNASDAYDNDGSYECPDYSGHWGPPLVLASMSDADKVAL